MQIRTSENNLGNAIQQYGTRHIFYKYIKNMNSNQNEFSHSHIDDKLRTPFNGSYESSPNLEIERAHNPYITNQSSERDKYANKGQIRS